MTRGLWPPPTTRWFPSLSGALAVLAVLPALGCATLGLTEKDPMRAELRRLEKEQRAKAVQEQLVDDAKQREREKHPDTVEGLIARGDANLAKGQVASALWDYAGAYELDPNAALPRERIGYVHLRHQPERAQPLFESALERAPDSVNGHIGLGLSLLAGGNRDEGLRHLQRAVELDPKSPKAQAALGVSLDQLGRREEAVAHLEAARNLRPHDSRILNNLGVAYLRSGQPERAEPLLRAALREDQRDVPLRQNNLGMALAMQGRFDEALEAFRGAGDEQSALSNLGYAHYARGEYDQAIAQYEKALLAGGQANVEVVGNLQAARRARDLARRAPGEAPPVAGAPPPTPAPRIDPGAIADEDSPVSPPASGAPN